MLNVKPGAEEDYEQAFEKASHIIASMEGYRGHELYRCLERKETYLLLIKWDTLEDHLIHFRQSEAYYEWKRLLHHFYDPFPTVEHFAKVNV